MTNQPSNQSNQSSDSDHSVSSPAEKAQQPPFGANEMRLNAQQWLAVAIIVLAFAIGVPRLWERIERFDTTGDYRIPYALSSDYWLYRRRVAGIASAAIPVLGDSVVWGEYVRPEGTLTHFLNGEAGQPERFVNCGVNGLFPLSMEGLVASYAGSLTNRKVIVHCNVLWMSSPKADLSTEKEETFNHASLVPQFFPNIPCYRADASTRLGAVAEREIGFFSWVGHLNSVYFDQQSIPRWTLAEDGSDPPRARNAWRNPLAQITLKVPGEPKDDPQRGPTSSRHKPWTAGGGTPTHFDWVSLNASLQWRAFQRTVRLLRDRGNDVLVILGPFNEHMVAEEQRPTLHHLQEGITDWLTANNVAHIVPETLPTDLYADDSHPLTNGYALLAQRIYQNPEFRKWLEAR
jgi:hypothetical protein